MSNKDMPQRWADRMVERGFTDPRYTADIPSLSRLAEVCGVHTSTISSAIKGGGRKPSAATVVALTKALGDDVADWLGAERPAAWTPPDESSLLTDRQRKAVEEIIRAMTERREDVTDDGSPSTIQAGVRPARSASVGASDGEAEVHELRPGEPEEELPWASHPKKGRESTGRRMRREMDEIGEENQDPGE